MRDGRSFSEILARILGEVLVGLMVGFVMLTALAALLVSLGWAHRAWVYAFGGGA